MTGTFSKHIITASILISSMVLTACGDNGSSGAANNPPVAVDDSFSVNEGGMLTTASVDGILANDSDLDNDVLTAILVTNVEFGILSLSSDGSFSYTHNGSENLNDSFSYQAFDGQLNSSTVAVSISVSAIDEAPVANGDFYSLSEGGTLTVTSVNGVLANDSDPENNTLTATLVSDVSFGVLSLNSDGSFSYTHNGSENQSDSFSYQAFDGQLNSSTVVVSISVSAINEVPVVNGDSYNSVSEGGTLTVTSVKGVLVNDSDPENNALTATLVSDVSFGVLSLSLDGSFSYTHNGSENLSDSFSYRAFDGQLNSNTVTVSIAVSAVNDVPVANGDSYSGVSEGGVLTVTSANGIFANDSDPENNTLTATLVSDVSFGVLSLNSDGSFSYTHNGSENLSDSFSYRASDGQLNSNTVTVSIVVSAVNEAPVAIVDSYNGVNEGETLTVTSVNGVLANDSDPENNALTATLVTDVEFGVLSLNPNGSFSYSHNDSENLSDSFSYRAFDGELNSNVVTVSINVTAINDAPVANADTYSGIGEGETLTVNAANGVLDNDSDPENNTLTASLNSGVSHGNLTLSPNGSFNYTHNGSANFTDSFTYRANDGNSSSNTTTVTINITNSSNQDPVASASCSTTAQKSAISGTLKATDADSSLLTFSLKADGSAGSGPMNTARGSVEITNSTTGAYTYTPSATGPRGSDSFDFFVEDPDGGSASATETIIVDQKIMPLGDSITRGSDGGTVDRLKVGYRKLLYDSLNNAGYDFDYVGSDNQTGKDVANFDSDNEGHSGWKALEIAFGGTGGHVNDPPGDIRDWLDDNPADIILLLIGTNDGPIPGSTEIDTEAILDQIDVWENSSKGNHVTIILAKIVDQNPQNPDVTAYNIALGIMASARATDDIIIVDMETALSYPADIADAVHPNPGGYAKMAPVWHADLVPVLDKCP